MNAKYLDNDYSEEYLNRYVYLLLGLLKHLLLLLFFALYTQ